MPAPLSVTIETTGSVRRAPFEWRPPQVRTPIVFAGLCLLVVALFFLELMIGPVRVPFEATLATLVGGTVERPAWKTIIWSLRVPRALTAMLAGAGLAAAGLQMQTLFRNPLADPWILGIVSGARLGVAIVATLVSLAGMGVLGAAGFVANVGLIGAAMTGAAVALVVLIVISRRVGVVTLLILGLVSDYIVTGLISVILHFTTEIQGQAFEGWDDGRFSGVTWNEIGILATLVVMGATIALLLAKPLNALLLGERYAGSVGTDVRQTRRFALVSTAMLAGGITAYCGPVSFIGVAVPHLCRGLFRTSNHRVLMPAVILMGALLAQTADFITNLPWPRHFLHLNACNALLGGPVVLWVVLRQRAMRELTI
jgi:iron complex transport system permease protein